MAEIVLAGVGKRYVDGTEAVRSVDLTVADGEFVILVGPSGCGKSTTLNMIAGLEDITSGELCIDGERVNERAPKDRDIAMVFQSYALYPHMTVRGNMAFPLTVAGLDKQTVRRRVEEAAHTLDLTQYLDRKPANLSGGQRQRVAMGRAIVRDPKAFLMDEPLSNLDAKLRMQMRTSVSQLQRRLGTTTVYVTHDQTEAMTLGDRLVVMRGGVVQQIGPPQDLYDQPANLFVAGFIGAPAMNFLPAEVSSGVLHTALGPITPSDRIRRAVESAGTGRDVIVGLRPEHIEDAALVDAPGGTTFRAPVEHVESMGSDKYAYFRSGGATARSAELDELAEDAGTSEVPGGGGLVARLGSASAVREGAELDVWFDADRLHVFDVADGRSLTRHT